MPGAGDIIEHFTVQKGTACPRLGLSDSPPHPSCPLTAQEPLQCPAYVLVCACTKTHARAHTQCQKQCTCARASLTQRAPSWELGQLLPMGRTICPSRPLPGVPRGLQQRPLSLQGGSVSRWSFTKRPPLELVPLESAQGLGWFGKRGQGCFPESQGGPSPGATSLPSATLFLPALASWPPPICCQLSGVQTAQWPRGGLGVGQGAEGHGGPGACSLRVEGSHLTPHPHPCGPRHVPDFGVTQALSLVPLPQVIQCCELIPLPHLG